MLFSFYWVNMCLVNFEIFKKVSEAISWTPGCFSCINSFNFLMTVFKNGQCLIRKVGNCPTTYIILEATKALLDFPYFFSQRLRSSFTTETTNWFSSSTVMVPEIDPRAQHNLLSLSKLKYSLSVVILTNLLWIHLTMDDGSIVVRKISVSLI